MPLFPYNKLTHHPNARNSISGSVIGSGCGSGNNSSSSKSSSIGLNLMSKFGMVDGKGGGSRGRGMEGRGRRRRETAYTCLRFGTLNS